ncbi:hypothetical protein AAMO2058_001505400 [Amorphochlora amoebiformis]
MRGVGAVGGQRRGVPRKVARLLRPVGSATGTIVTWYAALVVLETSYRLLLLRFQIRNLSLVALFMTLTDTLSLLLTLHISKAHSRRNPGKLPESSGRFAEISGRFAEVSGSTRVGGIGLGVGIGALGAMGLCAWGTLNGGGSVDIRRLSVIGKNALDLAGMVRVLIIAPLREEILFRGAILRSLAARYGFIIATLLSSAAFIALHSKSEMMSLGLVSIVSILSSIAYRVSGGRLAAPTLAHVMWNCAVFAQV